MTIKQIKRALEEKLFFTQLVSETLIVGTHPKSDPDFPQISSFDAFCSIEYKNKEFVIEYGRSNLPEYVVFAKGKEVVEFVEERFRSNI